MRKKYRCYVFLLSLKKLSDHDRTSFSIIFVNNFAYHKCTCPEKYSAPLATYPPKKISFCALVIFLKENRQSRCPEKIAVLSGRTVLFIIEWIKSPALSRFFFKTFNNQDKYLNSSCARIRDKCTLISGASMLPGLGIADQYENDRHGRDERCRIRIKFREKMLGNFSDKYHRAARIYML